MAEAVAQNGTRQSIGVRSAQTSQKQKLLLYCGLTVLGAAIFMVIKFFEYKSKVEHGLLPVFGGFEVATWFTDHDNVMANVPHGHLFFALYFTMTVFSTIGFGDITPVTEAARVIVMTQMVIGLLAVGVVAKLLFGAAKIAEDRSAAGLATGRATPPQQGPGTADAGD